MLMWCCLTRKKKDIYCLILCQQSEVSPVLHITFNKDKLCWCMRKYNFPELFRRELYVRMYKGTQMFSCQAHGRISGEKRTQSQENPLKIHGKLIARRSTPGATHHLDVPGNCPAVANVSDSWHSPAAFCICQRRTLKTAVEHSFPGGSRYPKPPTQESPFVPNCKKKKKKRKPSPIWAFFSVWRS